MIILDYKDRRPIYEQVIEKMEELMLLGVLGENEPLPSVRNLAMDLSINPNTIQRAYAELERQGYIYTVKGKGNFVSDSGQLLLRYKEEIFEEIKSICRTAFEVGITQEDIVQCIKDSTQAFNEKNSAGVR